MRRQALYIDFSNVTQLICFLRYITWFYSDKDEKLVAVEQELWKERNNVKLPVCFSLASGNLQTRVGLPWVEGRGQVLCLYVALAGKGQLYTMLRASSVAASQLLDFLSQRLDEQGLKEKEGIREGLQGVTAWVSIAGTQASGGGIAISPTSVEILQFCLTF